MPQRFLCALLTLTLILAVASNQTTMMNDNDNNDQHDYRGLPIYNPKNTLWYDEFQAYCQDRGLGWLLHSATGQDVETYDDMTSETFNNLKTTGVNGLLMRFFPFAQRTSFYIDSLLEL